jgi:hypothetical protein
MSKRTRPTRSPRRRGKARRHWFRALVLFLLSPGAFMAKGQEALFNEIGIQGAINSQSTIFVPPPEQPHLGPVLYNLGASTSLTYSDNINSAEINPESDAISQIGINVRLEWQATERSDLRLNTDIGYLQYFKYRANDGVVIAPGSTLDYALSWNDATLTFYNQTTYTRSVIAEPALANVATLPQFGNTTGLLGEWDPGHWTFQTSYSHMINLSNGGNDYLNSTSEEFYGRAGWRFARATQAGVEASGTLTSYQVASQSNNSSYSIGAYLDWQVKSWLQLTARGGPTFYNFYSQSQGVANSSLNSYYISFGINDQITDFLSQNLSVLRSIQLALNQGSSYVQQLGITYSLSWALTNHINLTATGAYDDGNQPLVVDESVFGFLIPIEATENYQAYSGALGAGWQFTDHLSAGLSYTYTRRDSNLSGRNYSDNSVSAQINYTF